MDIIIANFSTGRRTSARRSSLFCCGNALLSVVRLVGSYFMERIDMDTSSVLDRSSGSNRVGMPQIWIRHGIHTADIIFFCPHCLWDRYRIWIFN